jgi:hypothetical protein
LDVAARSINKLYFDSMVAVSCSISLFNKPIIN